MATVQTPPELFEMLQAFGLDPAKVFSFTFHAERGRPVTITVQQFATDRQIKSVELITKRFGLQEIKPEKLETVVKSMPKPDVT